MTDQLSLLPMLEQCDTSFDDNERKASQICDEEFERAKEPETEAKTDEDGWLICKTCGEKFAGLCKDGNCVECDYKKKHPDAQKKYCEQCIHFHYHNLYDENDHTECCCKLHLEGKNRDEWSYLCNDFVKCKRSL